MLCSPALPTVAESEPPSAALLEFLGEMEPVDEETWRILEHHANKDLADRQEENSE